VCLAVAILVAPLRVDATDYVVTRYDDPVPGSCLSTDCSLREAIIAANAASGADRIFLSAGSYELALAGQSEENAATGDLDLKYEVEIIGPGATMTTIDANSLDRVFEVYATGNGATIRGVTIRGGNLSGSGTAALVAGPYHLTIEDCEIRNNTGTGQAISASSGAVVTIRRSLFTANSAAAVSVGSGAGANLENTTVTANSTLDMQVNGNGSYLICTHCTIVSAGSGLLLNGFMGGTATFTNSIFSGVCGITNNPQMISNGGNIESPGDTCGFDQGDDLTDVTAIALDLGSLGDQGGPTRSFLAGGSSTAVNFGRDEECKSTDQRGATRSLSSCDSGSVEIDATRPPTPIFHDGFRQHSTGAWDVVVPN